MATLVNDRNKLLKNAATRVLGAGVVITSGVASAFTIPANGTTAIPGEIVLTAIPSRYISPQYVWSRKFSNETEFTIISGQTSNTLTVLGDAAFVTSALGSSTVQYKVNVTETSGSATNPSEFTLTVPVLRQGVNSVVGVLTNESQTVATDSSGVVPAGTVIQSTLVIYNGISDDSANWTAAITSATSGVSATLINGKTISVSLPLNTDNGAVEITASRQGYPDIVKVFSISKARTGASTTSYDLHVSAPVLVKTARNLYSPASITLSATSTTGSSNPIPYSGRFRLLEDGVVKYTSSTNQSSYTFTPTSTSVGIIKAELYLAGGISTLLDLQEVPVTVEGSSGITISVSNQAHILPADAAGAVATYLGSGTTIQVFEGSDLLTYRSTLGTNVSSFTIGTPTISVAGSITVGGRSGSGTTTATIAPHSLMANATTAVVITYPVTYNRANGAQATESVTQSLAKALAGTIGVRGSRSLYSTDVAYTSTYDFDGAGTILPGGSSYAAKATQLIGTAVAGSTPTTPINGDTVTFSNGANYVYTITHNGTSWIPPGTIIDGSLLVTESVTASKINSNGLEIRSASGDLILGSSGLQSYSLISGDKPPVNATAGATIGVNLNGQITSENASTYIANAAIGSAQIGSIALVGTSNFSVKSGNIGARMEMDSRVIKIYDTNNVLRVQIGDLTI